MTKIEILQTKNPELILCFQIGRGGHFHNAGHLSFRGEYRIDDSMFTEKLFMNEDETQYVDCTGREVGLPVDNDGTGTIDIDGDYDTTYSIHVADLSEKEFNAIKNRGVGFFGLSMDEFDTIEHFDEEIN